MAGGLPGKKDSLCIFLTPSQGKVGEAETLYRASHTWRRQKGVDRLIRWKPPVVLRNFYPGGFAGFDRDGSPVWIIPFGGADMKGWKEEYMIQFLLDISGMLACVSIEEFLDFTLKIVECSMRLMRKKSQSSGKPVSQHVFIFDLDGFSLKAATHGPTIEILQRLISVYEANYPETLKAAYVLNASSIFQIIFKIVKSTVQQKTLGKIQVFGTDGWKEPLLKSVPADILPTQWGGTKNGEGICMGGEVTEEYLQQAKPKEIPGMGEIFQTKIEAGSLLSLPQIVTTDCDLRWKFRSEGGDLCFGVKKKKSDSNSSTTVEDVLALSRVASHKDLQCGVLSCKAGFTYLLCFDNTFSNFRSKTVLYSVIMDCEEDSNELTVEEIVKFARDGLDTIEKEQVEKKKKNNGKTSKKPRNSFRKKKNQI